MLYEMNIGLNVADTTHELATTTLKAALNNLPYLLQSAVDLIATGYIPKGDNKEATLYVVFNGRNNSGAAYDLAMHLATELHQLAIPVRRADGSGFMVIPDAAAVPVGWATFNPSEFQGAEAVAFYPRLIK